MPRAKKDNIPLNIRLASDVSDRLSNYCEETGTTKTGVVEKALSLYLDDREREKAIVKAFDKISI